MTDSRINQGRLIAVYDCLSRSDRRYILSCLKEAEGPLALADLAEDVAKQEAEKPIADTSDETIKDMCMTLYHNHIPKLADANLIRYNQERNTVALAESSEELWETIPLLG